MDSTPKLGVYYIDNRFLSPCIYIHKNDYCVRVFCNMYIRGLGSKYCTSLVPRLSLSRTINYLMTFAPAESFICPRVQRSSQKCKPAGGEPGDEAFIALHTV